MRLFVFLLAFFGSLILRGATIPGALVIAIFAVVLFSLLRRKLAGRSYRLPIPGREHAPKIVNGDIGPIVSWHLKRGDRDAVTACIVSAIPVTWPARESLLLLVDEHCRLQRSIEIATRAGVPMPDDTAAFSQQQNDMISDRARRMAFVYQHGLMNPRIEASLEKLVRGTGELTRQSVLLRAELAESTGNPLWGVEEERELRRKLERMTNTLRAMSSEVLADEFDRLASGSELPTRTSPTL